MALKLRTLSPEEHETIEKLAHARTAAARLVERARIILLAHQGQRVPAIAQQLQLTAITVRTWLKRFNSRSRGSREWP
jgi:DNA-binding NarL/FixJ family response regulator